MSAATVAMMHALPLTLFVRYRILRVALVARQLSNPLSKSLFQIRFPLVLRHVEHGHFDTRACLAGTHVELYAALRHVWPVLVLETPSSGMIARGRQDDTGLPLLPHTAMAYGQRVSSGRLCWEIWTRVRGES